jgi:hypothetical protein
LFTACTLFRRWGLALWHGNRAIRDFFWCGLPAHPRPARRAGKRRPDFDVLEGRLPAADTIGTGLALSALNAGADLASMPSPVQDAHAARAVVSDPTGSLSLGKGMNTPADSSAPGFLPPAAHSTPVDVTAGTNRPAQINVSISSTQASPNIVFAATLAAFTAANDPGQNQFPRLTDSSPGGPVGSSPSGTNKAEGGGGGSGGGPAPAMPPGDSGGGGPQLPSQPPAPGQQAPGGPSQPPSLATAMTAQATAAAAAQQAGALAAAGSTATTATSAPATTPAGILGGLSISFEPNVGQVSSSQVQFLAHGAGYTMFLTSTGAAFALNGTSSNGPGATGPQLLQMNLVGANRAAQATGLQQLPGTVNYFQGPDPAAWRTNIPTYAQVDVPGVYAGVDLTYYSNAQQNNQLEYDFTVQPGADPSVIRLAYQGDRGLSVDGQGNLLIQTAAGPVIEQAPVLYQMVNGSKHTVSGRYVLQGTGSVGFQPGAYDPHLPLVIDPLLNFSTYLGGSGNEQGLGIAVDGAGNTYVTGSTTSTNFPLQSPYQSTFGGGTDVFVSKLNATGKALLYSTYLGGSGNDIGYGIAVDSSGNAYLTGSTTSTNFPVTAGAYQTTLPGTYSAFVTKLSSSGSSLSSSTFLGGSGTALQEGRAIKVDSSGNAYVTGDTGSSSFPTTASAYQRTYGGGTSDAFISEVNSSGSALVGSSYFGGSGNDIAYGLALMSGSSVAIVGSTTGNLPMAGTYNGGASDGFLAQLLAPNFGPNTVSVLLPEMSAVF